MHTPDVSIVIGTFNRADMLRDSILSLNELETEGRFAYEVIVVDNASTDHTAQLVQRTMSDVSFPIRLYTEHTKGVAAARNQGIAEARGKWIAFFDDDQLADRRWLIELMTMAEQKQCQAVGGDVKLLLPPSNRRDLDPVCRRLLGEMYGLSEPCLFSRKLVPGTNNLLIHRDVFQEVGVFDTTLLDGGEDADLYRRIRSAGYQTWFTPAAIVHHIIPEYRLETNYMRWTSVRQGNHVALRELNDCGRWSLPFVTAARMGQACAIYLPKFVMAKLCGHREKALGARCLLWRSEGYVRRAFSLTAPWLFGQESFFSQLDFREGRQKLVKR